MPSPALADHHFGRVHSKGTPRTSFARLGHLTNLRHRRSERNHNYNQYKKRDFGAILTSGQTWRQSRPKWVNARTQIPSDRTSCHSKHGSRSPYQDHRIAAWSPGDDDSCCSCSTSCATSYHEPTVAQRRKRRPCIVGNQFLRGPKLKWCLAAQLDGYLSCPPRCMEIIAMSIRREIKTGLSILYSRNIRLKKSGATGESIAVRSPSLAVARLAVDILIRPITGDNRVQCLCAVIALVTLAMPITSLRKHELSGKYHTAAPRTAATWLRLNLGRIHNRCPRS